MSAKVPRRPMTKDEVQLARTLGHCRFPIASFSKRFARDMFSAAMIAEPTITERQAVYLRKMITKYRRQIAADSLPTAERWLLVKERSA